MSDITIVTPSVAESMTTGFILGFKCLHRNKLYSCEMWRTGQSLRCQKEGRPIAWEVLPAKLRKTIHSVCNSMKKVSA